MPLYRTPSIVTPLLMPSIFSSVIFHVQTKTRKSSHRVIQAEMYHMRGSNHGGHGLKNRRCVKTREYEFGSRSYASNGGRRGLIGLGNDNCSTEVRKGAMEDKRALPKAYSSLTPGEYGSRDGTIVRKREGMRFNRRWKWFQGRQSASKAGRTPIPIDPGTLQNNKSRVELIQLQIHHKNTT